jgi:hypothetical protein
MGLGMVESGLAPPDSELGMIGLPRILEGQVETCLPQKIKHTYLPKAKALLPMFDAVVNSLEAIEDRKPAQPRIDVYVKRDSSLEGFDGRVDGFFITDNGVGFDAANLKSFFTSDSPHKAKRGAKGVGRFIWLKAFDHVDIESHYRQDGKMLVRSFEFTELSELPKDPPIPSLERAETTIVRLSGMKFPYKDECRQSLAVIGHQLVEHCLLFFIRPDCPVVTLRDDLDTIHLNQYFSDSFAAKGNEQTFIIGGDTFTLRGYRLRTPHENQRHQLLFAADSRVVESVGLGRYQPNLKRALLDDERKHFYFWGLIEGKYLNEIGNNERTAFTFPKSGDDESDDDVTLTTITEAALPFVTKVLEPFLTEINTEKRRSFADHIQEFPRHRWLGHRIDEFIDRIPPGANSQAIERVLHEVTFETERRLKTEGMALYDDIEKLSLKPEEYQEKLNKFIADANDLGKASLTEYVAHRKVILDFLEKSLGRKPGTSKYSLEETIHRIVYPMRTNSDEVPYSQQNLWIIDERLNYHSHLSSDRELRGIKPLVTASETRPDLLIFDRPIVFVEGDAEPLTSVTVIEFKQPDRTNYSKENPVAQVIRIIRDIKAGRFKDANGRLVPVANEHIPAYAYVICDLPDSLRRSLMEGVDDMTSTPDNMGLFDFHRHLNAYIEVISYNKLLRDSKRRNRVLFEKLNLGW